MGARHSKRSMDVTTTPKKEGISAEGGDASPVGDGKLERIEEADVKPTTNGVGAHTEAVEDKDAKDKDSNTEKEEKKETKEDEEAKVEETKAETPVETPTEGGDATTPTEGTPASPTSATSPDTKESKKKEKTRKKWSFRSISFGKKDKTKPVREDAPKNGDVSKEEPLTEGGEEAEASPVDEKSTPASPTEVPATPAEPTPESATTDDKNEASSTPAPTPVPLEAAKEAETIDKKPEVSQVQAAIVEPMVEVTSSSQPIVTTSIIERKTSEDFPSHFPSSPPPTPIDPSPLQQAQQSACHANQLAEALKLPAVSIVQSQCDNYSLSNIKITNNELQHSSDKSSDDKSSKELVVMSEEGPVPVSVGDVEEGPKQILPNPQPEVIEEITIEEVTQVEESIPVEEIEVDVIEEPDVLVPRPPPSDDVVIVEEIDPKEEEIPPPLPESPIPLPKASTDLLNFMSSQISDTPPLSSIIDCAAVPQVADNIEKNETTETDKSVETMDTDKSITEISVDEKNPQDSPQDIDDLPPPNDDSNDLYSSNNHEECLLTPPRSPSPSSLPSPSNNHSLINDNNSINDVRTETVNNVNHYHNNVIDKEDRLADNTVEMLQCPLNYAEAVKKDQSIVEPEKIVEKIVEVTKEIIEEAPKITVPSVTTEVSAPAPPVITEDVASVTKAIEEIDINEKAVAAAVNENIESVNTNEIIADMNHQNTLNE